MKNSFVITGRGLHSKNKIPKKKNSKYQLVIRESDKLGTKLKISTSRNETMNLTPKGYLKYLTNILDKKESEFSFASLTLLKMF